VSDSREGVGTAPYGQESVGSAGQESVGEAPAKKKFSFVRTLGALLVAGVIAVGGWFFSRDDAVNAKAGDCFKAYVGTTDIKTENLIVDCTSADAKFKVLGIVPNKTYAQAQSEEDLCAAWATTDDGLWLSDGADENGPGKVICLQTLTK
jgi:hypothetical protein